MRLAKASSVNDASNLVSCDLELLGNCAVCHTFFAHLIDALFLPAVPFASFAALSPKISHRLSLFGLIVIHKRLDPISRFQRRAAALLFHLVPQRCVIDRHFTENGLNNAVLLSLIHI